MVSMRIAAGASLHFVVPGAWRADWACGLPLIVLTIFIHVLGLGFMNQRAVWVLGHMMERRYPRAVSAAVIGATTLLATSLHALEVGIWAAAYRLLGTLPDYQSAMLYSLNAMTSYGHDSLFLEHRWQLMGAMEALNGWLLFGLTTAFLFGMIREVWLLESRRGLKVE